MTTSVCTPFAAFPPGILPLSSFDFVPLPPVQEAASVIPLPPLPPLPMFLMVDAPQPPTPPDSLLLLLHHPIQPQDVRKCMTKFPLISISPKKAHRRMRELNSRWARVQHKRYMQTRRTYYQSRQRWQKQMVEGMKCWEDVMDKYKIYFTTAEKLKATGGASDDLERLRLDIVATIDQFFKIVNKSSLESSEATAAAASGADSSAITLAELHDSNIINSDDDDDSDCCDCDCGCDD